MKTTDKMPFSNGSEFTRWKAANCDICDKYESTSTERNKAKCKYAYDLDYAQISGVIPIDTINYFGYKKYFVLADCPYLHCGRIKSYADRIKTEKVAKDKKKTELQF